MSDACTPGTLLYWLTLISPYAACGIFLYAMLDMRRSSRESRQEYEKLNARLDVLKEPEP
jgi:hypothetical protein